jgi:polysaccharide pyruvyl transferase WcaK-like protein
MWSRIESAMKWRYELHLSGKVDLFSSPYFYFKQYLRRVFLLNNTKVAYIYANKRNVGDYISFCGIKHVVGVEGPELFCSPLWNKQLNQYLEKLSQRNPTCLLIIGGGGLLQPVFEEFWQTILDSNLNFVGMGIGINKMKGRVEMNKNLLNQIANRSKFFGVRDIYTYNMLCGSKNDKVQLGICPSVNYVNPTYWQRAPERNSKLIFLMHPSDVRMAGADLEKIRETTKIIANSLGLNYVEHTNITNDYKTMLKLIQSSKLVISSRLHGCIMAYSCGVPFLPLFCDHKIEAFNSAHTGVKGVDVKLAENIIELETAARRVLRQHDQKKSAIAKKIKLNIAFGKYIKRMT